MRLKKILFCSIVSLGMLYSGCLSAQTEAEDVAIEEEVPEIILPSPEETELIVEEESIAIPSLEETEAPSFPVYTWQDFLDNRTCSSSIQFLKEKDFLTEEETTLFDLMKRYCSSNRNNIWEQLLDTFRQNKRALLLAKSKKEKSIFYKYSNMFIYASLDVHNTHPTGNTILDQLDKMQIAVQQKNLEELDNLINGLSASEKIFMTPTLNKIQELSKFKESLQIFTTEE